MSDASGKEDYGCIAPGAGSRQQTTFLCSEYRPLLIEFEKDRNEPRDEDPERVKTSTAFNTTGQLRQHHKPLEDAVVTTAGRMTGHHPSPERLPQHRSYYNGGGGGGGRLLETHFDDNHAAAALPSNNAFHTRSTSHSNVMTSELGPPPPSQNLNYSFPGCEKSSGGSGPYISASVMLPAREELGFYQNLSGRIKQQQQHLQHQQNGGYGSQRSSLSRAGDVLHKSPRTQELEEFAAKFEGYQMQRRRHVVQPTPMLDQLTRESQLWLQPRQQQDQQLTPLESHLLRLVQRTDSISRGRSFLSEESSSGRESVTTVISNSSNETLKYTDRHSSSETLRYSESGDAGGDLFDSTSEHHQSRRRLSDWGGSMDLSGVLPAAEQGLAVSPPPSGTSSWPDTGWSSGYPQEKFGGKRRPSDWSQMEQSSAERQSGSPVTGSSGSSRYAEPTSQVGGLGWYNHQADNTTKSILGGGGSRRTLCRSQSEAGSSIRMSTESPTASTGFVAPDNLRLVAGAPFMNNGGSYEGATAAAPPLHLYHARSDIQHCESSASSPRSPCPPPLLHSSSLGDMNGGRTGDHADYVVGKMTASSRSSSDVRAAVARGADADTVRQYVQSVSGSLPPLVDATRDSGSDEVIIKRGSKEGAEGGCSHCGSRHGAGYCPLAARGYPEKADEKLTLPRRMTARRKPKLPTPPCSPTLGTLGRRSAAATSHLRSPPCSTPSPPPLPPDHQEELQIISSSEPLPPPPQLLLNLHSAAVDLQPSTSRRLAAESTLVTPPAEHANNGELTPPRGVKNITSSGGRASRQPAATPKRDSPATIAAKEAPGWQMFLGFKSSTVSFTSEEVDRLRAVRDESRNRISRREEIRNNRAQQQQQVAPKQQPQAISSSDNNTPHSDQLHREESFACRLKRTESRGRKRTENPNSEQQPGGGRREPSCDQENMAPSSSCGVKKRQQLVGIVQQRSQQLLGRSAGQQQGQSQQLGRLAGQQHAQQQLGRSAVQQYPLNNRISVAGGKAGGVARSEAAAGRREQEELEEGRNNRIRDQEEEEDEGEEQQQPLHITRERSLKSITNWWRSSLEAGPTPPSPAPEAPWGEGKVSPSPKHNHSHSDSGISSISGRSSCMSPMSDMSSSSGSSRTSLRSSSIVSASNIPLEEEEEEEEGDYMDLCRELLVFAPQDSRIYSAIKSSLVPGLQVYFPEGSLQFEIVSNPKESQPEPEAARRGHHSSSFQEARNKLMRVAAHRIETQRKHQQLLRDSMKANEDMGKEVLAELRERAQQPEADKARLFIEEVDKITSLIIGLSSRLVRLSFQPPAHMDIEPRNQQQQLCLERREKLCEQLEEARKLRQSIFRRAEVVFAILSKHLTDQTVHAFGGFVKEKIRLILETRQHADTLKLEEDILKCLKEYSTGVMVI